MKQWIRLFFAVRSVYLAVEDYSRSPVSFVSLGNMADFALQSHALKLWS